MDEAREVAAEVFEWATEPCRFEWPPAALNLRALLWEDPEAARGYLERATEERVAFEQARAALRLGSLDVEPRVHLTDAYRRFDALGAGPWRRRAATTLREGVRSPTRRRSWSAWCATG